MTILIWAALGGLLGAVIRCLVVPGVDAQLWPFRFGKEAMRHAASGFFTGGILGVALPYVPADVLDGWLPGASKVVGLIREPFSAAFLAALLAYCGLDLTQRIRRRVGNGNGTGPIKVG